MALQMSSSSSSAATSLSFRPSVTSFISNINNNVSFQTSLKPARRFKTLVFIKKSPKRLIYASPRLPKMRYRNWMKHYQFSSQINMRLCGVWEHGLLYIEVDPEGADTWKLDAAVEFLKNGAVGVIPTDTVYAMVCDMTNHDAIERLRRLEEVETGKPFSILCRSLHDIDTYTTGFPRGNSYGFSDYFRAVKHCVPGPYTFILTASKALPKQCVKYGPTISKYASRKTLGVRIPDDVVCQAVLEKMGAPLISTSVRSPVENQWILDPVLIADTYGPVGLNFVIDAGVRVSNPSTVLDMIQIPPKIIRQGKGPKQQWMVEEDSASVQLKKETELTPRTYKHASGLWNFIFPYLSKLDTGWGRDRATGLQAEDISQACEDTNNKTQVVLSFSSDSEDEVVEVTNTQIISSLKKRKKVSPPTESSHMKKKPMTLQDTMDTKLDSFASDFKSVCGEMVEKIGVAANALTVDGNKSECVSEEKMLAVRTNFSTSVFISHLDVGKVVEACFNDPTKMKTLFTLPSYMRKAYVVGFLHPQI